jgi:hypothetical protein
MTADKTDIHVIRSEGDNMTSRAPAPAAAAPAVKVVQPFAHMPMKML